MVLCLKEGDEVLFSLIRMMVRNDVKDNCKQFCKIILGSLITDLCVMTERVRYKKVLNIIIVDGDVNLFRLYNTTL